MESVQGWVTDAIPPDEVYNEKHKQGSADHDRDSELQPNLQVAEIRDLANDVRSKTANQLCRKHVDTNGCSMRAARHHVMKHSRDGAVIPGHEEERDGKANKHG